MNKSLKIIPIASFLTIIFGFAGNIATYYQIEFFEKFKSSKLLPWLSILSPFRLGLDNKLQRFDAWGFFVLLILLIGAIMFVVRMGSETRLIGFVFSIVLIANIAGLFLNLFNIVFILKDEVKMPPLFFLMNGISWLFSLGYVIVSYIVLKRIKQEKEFDITMTEKSKIYKNTIKWQRFFHFVIDTLIMALVFLPILNTVIFRLIQRQNPEAWRIDVSKLISSNNFFVLGLIIVLRFLYYPLFEIIFGSTPAKFLTESRVVSPRTESPEASTIFKRTLYRNIPFNAVSFFWKYGWHDSLSYTYVVKEKRTGFKTNKLILLLVVFLVYIFTYLFGIDMYNEHQHQKLLNNREVLLRQNISNSIKNINENQVYVLEPLYDPSNETYFLKVKNVNGDLVETTKILHYPGSAMDVEVALKKGDVDSRSFYLKRQDLMDAVPKEKYPNYNEAAPKGTYYTLNNVHYHISKVYDLDTPEFKFDTQSRAYGKAGGGVISLSNQGSAGKIISFENVYGDLEIKNQLPVYFSAYEPSSYNGETIKLITGALDFNKNYVVKMKVQDNRNRMFYYQIHILKSLAEVDLVK